ncbi:MAG: hypothetical protein C5B50_21745 [Verrucomicrobia bacterium]|nr:MAG: hypothetical protein C5B50_21745 [Verrucomicrobiota bacterium]
MNWLKKNYEKLMLGVVLLAIILAVLAFIFVIIPGHNEKLNKESEAKTTTKVQPLPELDVTLYTNTLTRLATPATINFSDPNRLFNPMQWQKTIDGIRPLASLGPRAATVTNITPLYMKIWLDQVITADKPEDTKYIISMIREAAATPALRNKKSAGYKLNDKDKENIFQVVKIEGNVADPDKITLKLLADDSLAVLTKDKEKPFQRVEGYMASIFYGPENHPWRDQRVGSRLTFNGEDYNIVAITQNEVVLLAKSNQKKWTVKYSKGAS